MAHAIRIELLRKRFEMLARDLGWPLADHNKPVKEWSGCYAFQDYAPYYVKQYANESGAERNVSGYLSTRKEMLAWIEGAECAVKALNKKHWREMEDLHLQAQADAAQRETTA